MGRTDERIPECRSVLVLRETGDQTDNVSRMVEGYSREQRWR